MSTVDRSLSHRQQQVLLLLAQGWQIVDIARILGITHGTVNTYRLRIMKRLDLESDAQLAVYAYREGLTSWPFAKPGNSRREPKMAAAMQMGAS